LLEDVIPGKGHVRAALDAMPCGHMTWLATAQGKTRSHKAPGHVIAKAAAAAGFDKSAHGLRKSRPTSLADRGATTQQIIAWGSHASMSEVEHYTRSATRRSAVIGTEQSNITRPRVERGREMTPDQRLADMVVSPPGLEPGTY